MSNRASQDRDANRHVRRTATTGAPGRRAGVARLAGPAMPAKNRRGKLSDALKAEARSLRAQGVSLREIGRRIGVVHSGVYALLKQGDAPKPRRWGKRSGHCAYCEGPVILTQGSETRLVCERCSARASEILTIWSRERGDVEETLPPNLRKYSLSG
jgi:predicted DNA-binding transcriptional regulator AlpA